MKIQLATVGVAGALAGASAQTAQMSLYPGADATTGVSGNITISVAGNAPKLAGTVQVTYAGDLCKNEGECGIHVHTGTQCTNEEVGGHFGDFGTDPWGTTTYKVENNEAVIDVTAADVADSGHDNMINFIGRTIVMHAKVDELTPKKICGKILPDGLGETVVAADLKVYPGLGLGQAKFDTEFFKLTGTKDDLQVAMPNDATEFEVFEVSDCGGDSISNFTIPAAEKITAVQFHGADDLEGFAGKYIKIGDDCKALVTPPSSGYVTAKAAGGKVTLEGTLSGVAADLTLDTGSHGFHVHSGESCDNDGGHLKVGEDDPYDGWRYTSNANGIATAAKTTTVDVDFASIQGKPVVFHSVDGIKVACGVLSKIAPAGTDKPTTGGTTAEPTTGDASAVVLSAFAFAPALAAAYNAL